jgi:hypothetical protein
MPSRDEGDALAGFSGGRGGVGGAAEVCCSWEEGSEQHLKRAALLMREDEEVVVAMAKRVGDGRKEMARAAEMVAMGGGEW